MLAIVIPYYKIDFFEATLQSLKNQTNKQFTVYVGDDASANSPQSLLKKYEGSFNFKYKRFEDNLGGTSLTKQWERCINLIQDETWINILGDDDVLSENVVEAFYENVKNIDKENINLVKYASKLIDVSGNDLSEIFTHPKLETATMAYYKKFNLESRSSLSEYMFKRDAYNKHGFVNYPLGWHSDDKAWLDFSQGEFIYAINEAYFGIRRSTINISGKTDNLVLKDQARKIYLKDILTNSNFKFEKEHQKVFLFNYGILLKQQNEITIKNVLFVVMQFLRLGLFYDAGRFLRRMFRAKFLNK